MPEIQLLGQRCSGTNYLRRLLKRNLADVQITTKFSHKHLWSGSFDFDRSPGDTIFAIVVRNPYDWVRSVHRDPHHCSDLLGTSFSDFIRSRWQAWSGPEWNNPDPKIRESVKGPANLIEQSPNVLALRNAKVSTFLRIRDEFPNTMIFRLEDLQQNPQILMADFADKFDLELTGHFQSVTEYKSTDKAYKPKPLIKITDQDLEHIRSSLNWANERRLGFNPSDYSYDGYVPWHRYRYLGRQALASAGLYNRGARK